MNLVKNISQNGSSTRINVRTIATIEDLLKSSIKSIEINTLNMKNLDQIRQIISKPGETHVTLNIKDNNKAHKYKLIEKRKIDHKIILELKNAGVTLKIQ